MTHRKLYWILTILLYFTVSCVLAGLFVPNGTLLKIGAIPSIILFVIRIIVKVDNRFKR